MTNKLIAAGLICCLAACGGGGDPMTEEVNTDVMADGTAGDSDSGETPTEGDAPMGETPTPVGETPTTPPMTPDPPAADPSSRILAPQRIEQGSDIVRIEVDAALFGGLDVEIIRDGETERLEFVGNVGRPNYGITAGWRSLSAGSSDVALLAEIDGGRAAYVVSETVTLTTQSVERDVDGGIFIERTAETALPLDGTAQFGGIYAGTFVSESQGVTVDGVDGSIVLNVDFENAKMSGEITNRELINFGNPNATTVLEYTAVSLDGGVIDADGSFFLEATGGQQLGLADAFTSDGRVTGLMVGENGFEAVGVLVMGHNDGSEFSEIGVFWAAE